MQPLKQHFS